MARRNRAGKGMVTLLLGITWLTVPAQEPPTLTLRQAINQALGRNAQGAIARADVKAAAAGVSESRTAFLPRFNFTEDISRGNDPVYAFGTRLRQQRFAQSDFALNELNEPTPIGNFATRLSGQWMLFNWSGAQQQVKSAKFAAQSATSMSDSVNQAIVLNVVEAYQAVLYAQRRMAVAQHEQDTAQVLLRDAQTRVKVGLTVDADLLSAQVNLSERQQGVIAAEGDVDSAWAELQAAMGTSMAQQPVLQPSEARSYPTDVLADDIAKALKARSDLRALRQQTEARKAGVSAAKAEFGPQVSAYGNWQMDREPFAGNGGNNWVAGVQLNLDIFPLAKRARLAQQEAGHQRAEAAEQSNEQQIRLAVSRAWTAHRTAERIVQTAEASMEQAAESLRIIQNRYEAGLSTMTDLLRAEDAQRRSQDDYWRAVYGNTAAYANLLFSTGTLTPDSAESLQ